MTQEPALTVVVMGYLNQSTIVQSVRSLLTQESSEPFDTIVVTSGSDHSGALVRSDFPDIPVFEFTERLLPGATRNVGVRTARADLVAFLAADCVAAPGWVENRIAAHRLGHEAVAGAMAIPANASPIAVAGHFLLYPGRSPTRPAGPATQNSAYSVSYTRNLLECMGPFDETLRVGEDTAATARLNELGAAPWFEPSVQAEHLRTPSTPKALLKDQFWRGAHSARGRDLPIGRRYRRFQQMSWPGAKWLVVTAKSLTWWSMRVSWILKDARSSSRIKGRGRAAINFWIVAGSIAYQIGCGREWFKNWTFVQEPDPCSRMNSAAPDKNPSTLEAFPEARSANHPGT